MDFLLLRFFYSFFSKSFKSYFCNCFLLLSILPSWIQIQLLLFLSLLLCHFLPKSGVSITITQHRGGVPSAKNVIPTYHPGPIFGASLPSPPLRLTIPSGTKVVNEEFSWHPEKNFQNAVVPPDSRTNFRLRGGIPVFHERKLFELILLSGHSREDGPQSFPSLSL